MQRSNQIVYCIHCCDCLNKFVHASWFSFEAAFVVCNYVFGVNAFAYQRRQLTYINQNNEKESTECDKAPLLLLLCIAPHRSFGLIFRQEDELIENGVMEEYAYLWR